MMAKLIAGQGTTPRSTGRRKRLLATTAAVLMLGGGVAQAQTHSADRGEPTANEVGELVDAFEGVAPFRGDENHLPDSVLDGFHLGTLALYPDDTGRRGSQMDGYVDYGTTSAGYGIIAAGNGPGEARVGFVVNDESLTSFSIPLGLPEGAVVHNEDDTGTVEVVSDEGTTTLAPAVAVDADGKEVNARYQIINHRLVIDVDTEGATLPILVDPVTSNYVWGYTDWYSRSDVRFNAGFYQTLGLAKVGCNRVPNPALKWACQQTVSRYAGWISDTWQYARNTNQCLTMSVLWTGQVTGIRAYACNWG